MVIGRVDRDASAEGPLLINLFLGNDPFLKRNQKGRDHVELVGIGPGTRVILMVVVLRALLPQSG